MGGIGRLGRSVAKFHPALPRSRYERISYCWGGEPPGEPGMPPGGGGGGYPYGCGDQAGGTCINASLRKYSLADGSASSTMTVATTTSNTMLCTVLTRFSQSGTASWICRSRSPVVWSPV